MASVSDPHETDAETLPGFRSTSPTRSMEEDGVSLGGGSLKEALRDALEQRGVLDDMRAQLRAHLFGAIHDERRPRLPLSNENLLLNELIREYLVFNHYNCAASTLVAESGQPPEPMQPGLLQEQLGVERGGSPLPLLYLIFHRLQQDKASRAADVARRPGPSAP